MWVVTTRDVKRKKRQQTVSAETREEARDAALGLMKILEIEVAEIEVESVSEWKTRKGLK